MWWQSLPDMAKGLMTFASIFLAVLILGNLLEHYARMAVTGVGQLLQGLVMLVRSAPVASIIVTLLVAVLWWMRSFPFL